MEINFRTWNRKILNSLWITTFITSLVTTVNFFFTKLDSQYYIMHLIILPTLLLLFVMATAEFIINRLKRDLSWLVILVQTTFASIITGIHFQVDVINAILLFPIFTSIIYFNRKILNFSTFLVLTFFICMQFLHPALRANFILIDFITFITILLLAGFFSLRIMERIELMKINLQSIKKHKEELLVRGILLEKETKTDTLTGLNNRLAFQEYLDILTNGTVDFQLAILDIDNFKQINDSYGHRVGDLVLQQVAESISKTLQVDDVVARIGGEEFALLLTGKTMNESYQLLEKLRESITRLHIAELDGHTLTISGGIHPYDRIMGQERLFEMADASLYRAKQSGKNRIIFTI